MSPPAPTAVVPCGSSPASRNLPPSAPSSPFREARGLGRGALQAHLRCRLRRRDRRTSSQPRRRGETLTPIDAATSTRSALRWLSGNAEERPGSVPLRISRERKPHARTSDPGPNRLAHDRCPPNRLPGAFELPIPVRGMRPRRSRCRPGVESAPPAPVRRRHRPGTSRISRRKPWMLMRSYASVTVVNSAQTRQRGSVIAPAFPEAPSLERMEP